MPNSAKRRPQVFLFLSPLAPIVLSISHTFSWRGNKTFLHFNNMCERAHISEGDSSNGLFLFPEKVVERGDYGATFRWSHLSFFSLSCTHQCDSYGRGHSSFLFVILGQWHETRILSLLSCSDDNAGEKRNCFLSRETHGAENIW